MSLELQWRNRSCIYVSLATITAYVIALFKKKKKFQIDGKMWFPSLCFIIHSTFLLSFLIALPVSL